MSKNSFCMTHEDVYKIVRQIPEGKIATYGQIARLAGYPRHARQVGYALAHLKNNNDKDNYVPWHRVVNSQGAVSPRGTEGGDEMQKIMLEDEGVLFNEKNKISLKQFQWEE